MWPPLPAFCEACPDADSFAPPVRCMKTGYTLRKGKVGDPPPEWCPRRKQQEKERERRGISG